MLIVGPAKGVARLAPASMPLVSMAVDHAKTSLSVFINFFEPKSLESESEDPEPRFSPRNDDTVGFLDAGPPDDAIIVSGSKAWPCARFLGAPNGLFCGSFTQTICDCFETLLCSEQRIRDQT